jgi:uncharacterized protein with PIN domain
MTRKKRLKKERAITQCEKCQRRYCPEGKIEACAKAEFDALAAGDVYVCPDCELGYWAIMEAA